MTYSDLAAALTAYLTVKNDEPSWLVVLPRIIEQAELRCYREVDFMATRKYATASVPVGASLYAGPPDWLIGRYVSMWPVTLTTQVRTTLTRREENFLQEIWPDRTAYVAGVAPKYWAEMSAGTLLFAPSADQVYAVEMAYTYRPAALSAINPSTWLSANAPDMLLYAALIAGSGYQKNFGRVSDDPQMAMTWEQQYQTAKQDALREEARRKAEAMFDPIAAPPSTTQVHGP